MIYIRFVTSGMAKELTRRRAISELRKIEREETDEIYLVIGTSANGEKAKTLRQQEVIKKSDQNRRVWIVDENNKTAFFDWAEKKENITLSEVRDETPELAKNEQKRKLLEDEQKQNIHRQNLYKQAQAHMNARNSLVINAVPNFDDYPHTKFEEARIIAARALQISGGSPIFVEPNGIIDSVEIAKMEFDAGVCPITVKREANPTVDAENKAKREFVSNLKNLKSWK